MRINSKRIISNFKINNKIVSCQSDIAIIKNESKKLRNELNKRAKYDENLRELFKEFLENSPNSDNIVMDIQTKNVPLQ